MHGAMPLWSGTHGDGGSGTPTGRGAPRPVCCSAGARGSLAPAKGPQPSIEGERPQDAEANK